MLKKTVFARLAGDRSVMALPDSILGVLPKSPLSYRDRTILAVDPGRVSRLTIARAEGTYTLVAADDPGKPPRWRMSAPVEGPADDESVARVLGMLAPLRAERLVAEELGDGKAFGLDAPGLSVTWSSRPEEGEGQGETSREPQTLRISLKGPTADTFYANVTGSPLVFTVGGPQLQPLLAEFRDHRVLSFPAAKVTRLVLRWPGRTLSLAREAGPAAGPSAWKRQPGSEGIRFDLSRLDALVNALASLSVPRFTQYAGPFPESAGLDPPRLAIEVELAGEPGAAIAQGRQRQGRRCALRHRRARGRGAGLPPHRHGMGRAGQGPRRRRGTARERVRPLTSPWRRPSTFLTMPPERTLPVANAECRRAADPALSSPRASL